jgi:hypothetical protein
VSKDILILKINNKYRAQKTLCLNLIKTKNKLSAGTSFGCTTQQAKL